jgi:CspA family cold shock protein
MPQGKIKLYNEQKGYRFIQPDDGGNNVFFHITEFGDDDIIVGAAVTFEIGIDKKSGKTKAVSVDLT